MVWGKVLRRQRRSWNLNAKPEPAPQSMKKSFRGRKNGRLKGPQAGPNSEHSRSSKEAREAGAMSNEKSGGRWSQNGDVWRRQLYVWTFVLSRVSSQGRVVNRGCDMIWFRFLNGHTVGWRMACNNKDDHNEPFYNTYCVPDTIRSPFPTLTH